ncbi:MAG TPA: hypothetical protein VH394_04775 [Thermoanaerobaculia bacterium]|nr:hypothetical protein [Thermoanaerobaculia bacterium]
MRCLALAILLAAAPVRGEILFTGTFHGDEMTARSGETWLCLMATKTGDELKTCTVDVKTVFDPIMGANTGKKVSIRGGGEAVVLVRNIPGLKPGPVRTLFSGLWSLRPENGSLLLGPEMRLEMGREGVWYTVEFWAGSTRKQVLWRNEYVGDGPPMLHWAGDLDRDGKLDLLIDITDHDNLSRMALFLSSLAKEGELVGLAGLFDSVGC